jgi:hypothetical protein
MMDREQMVREMIAAEVAPLVGECQSMIDRAEAAIPILLDQHERDAARVERNQWRSRAGALLKECSELEDKILKLADQRFPGWRG